MLHNIDLEVLPQTRSVSDVIPLNVAVTTIVESLCGFAEKDLGVRVVFREEREDFPNSRGDIHYDFESKIIVVGGALSDETALRVLFFVAHGLGHVAQRKEPRAKKFQDAFIRPASLSPGLRQMEEPLTFDGQTRSFREWFTPIEIIASDIGWRFVVESCVKSDNVHALRRLETVRFWYCLYAIVDHLYHKQSITGPWQEDSTFWRKTFGSKLEAVLAPFALLGSKDSKHLIPKEPLCIYARPDGTFAFSTGEIQRALHSFSAFFRDNLQILLP